MIINDRDLRQINRRYIESLDKETALKLALNLLADLKETREKLNQSPSNNSHSPGIVLPNP